MPIEFVEFDGVKYPAHESIGGASLWIRPLAQYYCKGENGIDIGYCKPQWQLPGTFGVEPSINTEYDAMNLPYCEGGWDYIHSSHCLEHVKENWQNVLDNWFSVLKSGGILFLYLPHISQKYWNTQNNRKHVHQFSGDEIWEYVSNQTYFKTGFKSGPDFNHSFVVVIEKL